MKTPTLVCPAVIGGTAEQPTLLGNRCRACGEPFFPAARGCTRCSSADLEPFELGDTGTLWSWTIQLFQPKAPFDGVDPGGSFQPYGIGYVEMPCGLKVETRLAAEGEPHFAIGQAMRLVLQAYRKDASAQHLYTYAFEVAA